MYTLYTRNLLETIVYRFVELMLHITDTCPSIGRQQGWPHRQAAGILMCTILLIQII